MTPPIPVLKGEAAIRAWAQALHDLDAKRAESIANYSPPKEVVKGVAA